MVDRIQRFEIAAFMAFLVLAAHSWSDAKAGTDDPPVIKGCGPWSEQVNGLESRVTPGKMRYKIGDPIHLLVEVANRARHPIALGLEPLLKVGEKQFARQRAELQVVARQGSGYFSTTYLTFPVGTPSEAQAVVIQPGRTYSATIRLKPWGVNLASVPSRPGAGKMRFCVTVRQSLMPELDVTQLQARPVEIDVQGTSQQEGALFCLGLEVPDETPALHATYAGSSCYLGSPRNVKPLRFESGLIRPRPADIARFRLLETPRQLKSIHNPERADIENILSAWREVPKEKWLYEYSHVAFLDHKGIFTLHIGNVVEWMIRPGGLANLTFGDGFVVYLVRPTPSAEQKERVK